MSVICIFIIFTEWNKVRFTVVIYETQSLLCITIYLFIRSLYYIQPIAARMCLHT